ncbi:MAG TPA: hypothetical protein PKY12_06855 [Catalimonadaceae bacterium]|jgi:hypothetical protein|nr:hypothetical protein [Catalimonadaceae bacterium]
MKLSILSILLFFWTIGLSLGQENRWIPIADLSISGSQNHFTISPGFSWLYGLGKSRKFNLGIGFRYSGAFSQNQNFTTAPARLTSGQEGPQVLFAPDKPENVDTFQLGNSWVNALNLAIYLQYNLNEKWQLGFNIDAIGVSFGTKTRGNFNSIKSDNVGLKSIGAKPYPFNVLLVSDNDLGSLNSELFLRYFFKEKWAIKVGATFIFTEYQTDLKPAFDNDRFRHKSLQVMLGLSYKIKN